MTRVAIVGGGLAGTAAATILAQAEGVHVDLFERRTRLGGRAGSFYDPIVGRNIDNCQHVLMGCCTEAFRFYESMGAAQHWCPLDSLRFVDRTGRAYPFRAAPLLPPPLHLAPAFARMRFLSVSERIQIARAMRKIPRRESTVARESSEQNSSTFGDWLRRHGQSDSTINRFWDVIVRGALAASCDDASLAMALKVFRDAFLTTRTGHTVYTPRVSLDRLHHEIPLAYFQRHDVNVHLGCGVREVVPPRDSGKRVTLRMRDSHTSTYDAVLIAVPWHTVDRLLPSASRDDATRTFFERYPCCKIPSSAITAVHVWLDRPLSDWEHAVLIDEQGDWMFRASEPDSISDESSEKDAIGGPSGYHYMLVSSGTEQSPNVRGQDAAEAALNKLRACMGKAERQNEATLPKIVHWRFKHHPRAVFSVRPETEAMRPPQTTPMPGVYLAGDATQTGWPGTIEGAVRSGRAAADAILNNTMPLD
jgi:squalene-associated FAD-dependent desaturase